uniref:C5 protein n=1 Tax=Tomato yellow leaf curl virus TaxID=10832 RepID=A0A6G7AET8_9GEMI|nr:C5 protein [Tomato yellow leaf curl virus]QIH13498.1 C5 protein [Tomato yellow leaf curl virus]QIH13505.1 C5 protein [Tomato yellow leaf curl virus]QIH13547.1 C5 protein [Tomato yellow leaf curl virus]
MKFPHHLKPIPQIILHGCGTGLIIEHIKNLSKIHWAVSIGPSITNQEEHDLISMILLLNIFIHPDFT